MINTLYQEKNGKFQRKKAQLTVQAIVENKGNKKVGTLSLNIADYSSSPVSNKAFALEGCPDKNARIIISVRAQALGEAMAADNMSEASGVTGFSMGTEGEATFLMNRTWEGLKTTSRKLFWEAMENLLWLGLE